MQSRDRSRAILGVCSSYRHHGRGISWASPRLPVVGTCIRLLPCTRNHRCQRKCTRIGRWAEEGLSDSTYLGG